MPRCGAGPAIGVPHIRASPEVGVSKPAMMRNNVDFPQPEAPMSVMNSPFTIVRLASLSAVTVWPATSNIFETPRTSMMGSGIVGWAPAQETAAHGEHNEVGQES